MKNNLFIVVVVLIQIASCVSNRVIVRTDPPTIPVPNERLYLAPIILNADLGQLDGWPEDQAQQKVLLENFTDMHKKIKAEFRRCEKFGMYTVVDDTGNPTVRISIEILSADLTNDTLKMPVQLQAEKLHSDQKYIYSLPVSASTENQQNRFRYSGMLLTNYKRLFPYNLLVSFFYSH